MNLGKVEIWETSLDRIVTLREAAKGVLRLAKTQDFSQLDASLATLSARLPYGQRLLSQWNKDQSIYHANNPGSGLAMQQQMLSDTVAYVQNGVTERSFRVIGSGSSVFYRPASDLDVVYLGKKPQPRTYYYFDLVSVTNLTGMKVDRGIFSVTTELKPPLNKFPPFDMIDNSTYILTYAQETSSQPPYTLHIKGGPFIMVPHSTRMTGKQFDENPNEHANPYYLSYTKGKFVLTG